MDIAHGFEIAIVAALSAALVTKAPRRVAEFIGQVL